MVPTGNKAKNLSSVNHTTKTIHHHLSSSKHWITNYAHMEKTYCLKNKFKKKIAKIPSPVTGKYGQNFWQVVKMHGKPEIYWWAFCLLNDQLARCEHFAKIVNSYNYFWKLVILAISAFHFLYIMQLIILLFEMQI